MTQVVLVFQKGKGAKVSSLLRNVSITSIYAEEGGDNTKFLKVTFCTKKRVRWGLNLLKNRKLIVKLNLKDFRIFLSIRFYVKLIFGTVEDENLPFLHI